MSAQSRIYDEVAARLVDFVRQSAPEVGHVFTNAVLVSMGRFPLTSREFRLGWKRARVELNAGTPSYCFKARSGVGFVRAADSERGGLGRRMLRRAERIIANGYQVAQKSNGEAIDETELRRKLAAEHRLARAAFAVEVSRRSNWIEEQARALKKKQRERSRQADPKQHSQA